MIWYLVICFMKFLKRSAKIVFQKKASGDGKTSKTSTKGKSNANSKPVPFTVEGQKSIGNMEAIRNHLHGMLKMDGALGMLIF